MISFGKGLLWVFIMGQPPFHMEWVGDLHIFNVLSCIVSAGKDCRQHHSLWRIAMMQDKDSQNWIQPVAFCEGKKSLEA
jgi:hypothetical protein